MYTFIRATIIGVLIMVLTSCRDATGETITFYDVPLGCVAAPFGCGSLAKPSLLDLEKDPSIKEAWLNRPGTAIAIVWKGNEPTPTAVKRIFDANHISFIQTGDTQSASYLATFRNDKVWYRGAGVDQLSFEEASVIANRYVGVALDEHWITQEEGNKIRPDMEKYFQTELVKLRTVDELNSDIAKKFPEDVWEIYTTHIGQERTTKLIEQFGQWKREQHN